MKDQHEELRSQYEKELESNPDAYKNWQMCASKVMNWMPASRDDLSQWCYWIEYRRNPDAPPLPETKPKRHPNADLLIAAANGDKMQRYKVQHNGFGIWIDCDGIHALSLIANDSAGLVRIKPALKLIDWAKLPVGTMTTHGEILAIKDDVVYFSNNVMEAHSVNHLIKLRLEEQTKFTYWPGGKQPMPDGLMVEVVLRDGSKDASISSDFRWAKGITIIAYRILGLADGWTDDAAKAGF